MRLLVRFSVMDQVPVPWKVPEVMVVGRAKGVPRRVVKVPARLRAWQEALEAAARPHAPTGPIHLGPLLMDVTFYKKTPPGFRHGQLWCPDVHWNPEIGKFTKHGHAYQTPDLTNLLKGTEDILEGIFFANDGQTCVTMTRRLYGPRDGVEVLIHVIEPGDFPGHGEAVA